MPFNISVSGLDESALDTTDRASLSSVWVISLPMMGEVSSCSFPSFSTSPSCSTVMRVRVKRACPTSCPAPGRLSVMVFSFGGVGGRLSPGAGTAGAAPAVRGKVQAMAKVVAVYFIFTCQSPLLQYQLSWYLASTCCSSFSAGRCPRRRCCYPACYGLPRCRW